MIKQRLDEWMKDYDDDYFNRQFKTPYRSTVKFCDWLEEIGALSNNSRSDILDIGTGKGSNLYYMNKRFPQCNYLGVDVNHDFIEQGNIFFNKEGINNCRLEYGDLYNFDSDLLANKYEGITCYQTLSWLPEYESALDEIIKLNARWISLTSLFYDGLVDCKIEVKQFKDPEDKKSYNTSFYNIYSIPRIKKFFEERGYNLFKYCPFDIDIDLPKPTHSNMQTYTKELKDNKRLQISGPLLMNWYFIYAEKMK